jgi:hypothetical protein
MLGALSKVAKHELNWQDFGKKLFSGHQFYWRARSRAMAGFDKGLVTTNSTKRYFENMSCNDVTIVFIHVRLYTARASIKIKGIMIVSRPLLASPHIARVCTFMIPAC